MDSYEVSTIIVATVASVATIVAAFSAYRQYKINQGQYKLNLFDKRYKSFVVVKEFIELALSDQKEALKRFPEFKAKLLDVDFIFGTDVSMSVGKIYTSIIDLISKDFEIEELEQGNERKVAAQKKLELRKKLCNELEQLNSIFKPYLDLSKAA